MRDAFEVEPRCGMVDEVGHTPAEGVTVEIEVVMDGLELMGR